MSSSSSTTPPTKSTSTSAVVQVPPAAVPPKKKNPLLAMTAGCIAGGIEATCVWPMEYIKTQLQLQSRAVKELPYKGMISGLIYTVRTTGFFSLYRGLAPTLIGSIPKAGIRFGGNAFFREQIATATGRKVSQLSPPQTFVAGLGAGITEALIIVAPVETVKTKCIELNQSFGKGLVHIFKNEGIRGIYQGATATALKQGSNQGLRFMWFHEYKAIVTNKGETPMTPLLGLFGGMSAGCFSTLGNNPFDVVKTRLQGTQAARYKSTLDCFVQILRTEGIAAFYAGVIPRMGRVVPGQGIIFMSFETIQQSLQQHVPFFQPKQQS